MIIGISGKKQSGKDTVGKIIQCLTAEYSAEDILDVITSNIPDMKLCPFSDETSWEIKKFAGKVKEILSILTGIPVEDMEKEKVKNSYLGEEWYKYYYTIRFSDGYIVHSPHNISKGEAQLKARTLRGYNPPSIVETTKVEDKITVRQALQWIGTDLFRDKFHPNTWVNSLFTGYKSVSSKAGLDADSVSELVHGIIREEKYPNWIITDVRFPNEAQAIKDRGGILIRVMRYGDPNEEVDFHESEIALDSHEFDYYIDNNGTIEELIEGVKEILIKEKLI
jgi:hypothetical protein